MSFENGKILVVDDESLNRVLIATNLRESGYSVETAQEGKQALQMLRAQPYDVALLDLLMPIMDGYQVLAEMKNDVVLRRIPVIVISSMDEMDSIVRCIEMGATDYLTKPVNPVLLHARIRASLASLQEERMAILREQFAQVTLAQEEERKRIAQELHDGLGPMLASINIRLVTVRKLLQREGHPASTEVEELAEQAQSCIRDIRRLIHDLRPVALDELGLVPALRNLLGRFEQENNLSVEFIAGKEERLPDPVETALFRIVQEALNNVLKHAQAKHVRVILEHQQDHVHLCVSDDGQGFDTLFPRSGRHVGLWSMQERMEQLGGQFKIKSLPHQGTTVNARVPL